MKLKNIAIVAMIHLIMTAACIVSSLVIGLSRFDHPELPTSHFDNILNFMTDALAQPAMTITEMLNFGHMNSLLEWVIFLANSLAWGTIIIYGYSKIHIIIGLKKTKNK